VARPRSKRSPAVVRERRPDAARHDLPYRLDDQADHGGGDLLLVEQCKLRLDDPVDDLLPELANRRVLKSLEGPVDDTMPAQRPISARDLLTFTFGLGAVMVWPARHPIQKAVAEAGLAPGPSQPDVSADDFMKRLGSLPLIYQPANAGSITPVPTF